MDDKQFDNRIKSKVGDFEDPTFDPSALAALHNQMGSISVWPWYAQYKTELLVGSGMVLCTLIILWSQWLMSHNTSEVMNDKIAMLQVQQAEIVKLQQEIVALKNTTPDTIRIIEIRKMPSSDYEALRYRISVLETEVVNMTASNREHNSNIENEQRSGESFYYEPNFALENDSSSTKKLYTNPSLRLSPRPAKRETARIKDHKEQIFVQPGSQHLSTKTLRDLEKHYQKGIGIRVGPTLELSKGFYQHGSGKLDLTAGVLADFILSQALSLETGVKYVHRVYNVESKHADVKWPGVDESLGTLENVDIDSWIFEIPLNLKYRYPLSIKTHWLVGIGYSSIVYGSQLLEYEYKMESNPSATISSDYQATHATVYPGTLNFSLGLSNQLKSKKILETSIYYQHGLGITGLDNIKPNFLGARGVYWFKVR